MGLLILAPLPARAATEQPLTAPPDRAVPPAPERAVPPAQPQKATKPKDGAGAGAKSADKPKAAADAKGKDKAKDADAKDQAAVPPSPQPVDAPTAKAATEAATAYLTALKEKGFAAAPAHLHPSALARFKALVLPRLKDEQARGTRTLLNATFGREVSVPTAAAADPADFLTRFARLISAREPDAAPRFSTLTPIGVVREDDQLHVLLRLTQPGNGPEAIERIEVVSLKPQAKDWKVLLDARLQALALTLGGNPRGEAPRANQPRFEPLPEGLPPAPAAPATPAAPAGPAGLLPIPTPPR